MDNSIYIALSRQVSLFREMAFKANNLANVNSTGYKVEEPIQRPFITDGGRQVRLAYSQDERSYRDLREGALQQTNNPFDVAISGPGYFVVETPLGQRYTRAGSFHLDGEGTLVNSDGYPVLDDNGQRLQFDANDQNIQIGEAGNISVTNNGNNIEERGSIAVREFENPQLLEQAGNNLYKSEVEPALAEGSRVLHGVIEGSNVQPVTQLVDMLQVSRAVGNTAKLIDTMYDLQRRAGQGIARGGNG